MSEKDVSDKIKRVKNSTSHGVVCVDMLNEGIDIPDLKIAGLHTPHKSLPITLQFIGRLSRSNSKFKKAFVVGNKDELLNEFKDLMREDASWTEILSKASLDKINKTDAILGDLSKFESAQIPLTDININAIRTKFNTCIYKGDIADISTISLQSLKPIFSLNSEINEWTKETEESLTKTFVIKDYVKPSWLNCEGSLNIIFQYIIIHHNTDAQLTFLSTSIQEKGKVALICKALKLPSKKLSPEELMKVFNEVDDLNFYSIGLKNRLPLTKIESYRMMSGNKVDEAIQPLNSHLFNQGHAYGGGKKNGERYTCGVSLSSKVWSPENGSIAELGFWYKSLIDAIQDKNPSKTNTKIDLISHGEAIGKLNDVLNNEIQIFAVDWDPIVYEKPIYLTDNDKLTIPLTDCQIDSLTASRNKVSTKLIFSGKSLGIDILTDSDVNNCISTFPPASNYSLVLNGEQFSLKDFLLNHPLQLYLNNGANITSNIHYPINSRKWQNFKDNLVKKLEVWDWSEVAINNESKELTPESKKEGKLFNVQDYAINKIPTDTKYIFDDDGTGEIADIISFDIKKDTVHVTLHHCKYTSSKSAGLSLKNIEQLYQQAFRSSQWLNINTLLDRIKHRITLNQSYFRKPKATPNNYEKNHKIYEDLLDDIKGKVIEFHMNIVQPGISLSKIDKIKTETCAGFNTAHLMMQMIEASEHNGFETIKFQISR